MNQEHSLKMRTKPIGHLIATMSLPAIFSMFIQALYNIVDTFYVAKIDLATDNYITALGYAFPIQMLILAFSLGIGIGTNVIVAKKLGERNLNEASNMAKTGILLAFIGAVLFFILSFIIVEPFMNFMSDNPEIIKHGTTYLRIIVMLSSFSIMEMVLSKILQGMGRMLIPMFAQLIGAISNIILDPLFIFGGLGIPAMGVAGAAYASIIGQVLAFLFVLITIIVTKSEIKFGFKNFKIKATYISQIFKIGLPSMVMNVIGSLTNIFLNRILKIYDPTEVANGVLVSYSKLQSFVFMPVFGLNQGGLPIMSYNYGANIKERYLKAQKILFITAVIIMTLGFLIFQFFPETLLGLFTPSDDLLTIGTGAIKKISYAFIPAGIAIITTVSYQSLGRGFSALIMSASRQALLLVPLAYILGSIGGLDLIWYAFPIAEIIVTVIFALLLFKIVPQAFLNREAELEDMVVMN